jgi:sarcosine oxidase
VRVGDGWQAVLERDAGFVDPEATVRAHLRLARAAGAELRAERVVAIEPGDEPAVVTTARRYRARSVIVAAGPWAPGLLSDAGLPIVARRKVVAHFTPRDGSALGPAALPGFVVSDASGLFYGFPFLPGHGVRIGRHDGGEYTTADTVDRAVRPEEVAELRALLERVLPDAAGPLRSAVTCLYTMSPDGDFLLGPLAGAPGVVVATGCSGHAFKFVPALGEALADLATGRRPRVDLGFLDPARFPSAAPARPGATGFLGPE